MHFQRRNLSIRSLTPIRKILFPVSVYGVERSNFCGTARVRHTLVLHIYHIWGRGGVCQYFGREREILTEKGKYERRY